MTSGTRDVHRRRLIDSAGQDVRHALRGFARNPGFALAAVLTMALGIGPATAVFSVASPEHGSPPPGGTCSAACWWPDKSAPPSCCSMAPPCSCAASGTWRPGRRACARTASSPRHHAPAPSGFPFAVASARLVRSLLVDVPARDLSSLAVAMTVLMVAAAIAAWAPSRRAAKMDPMVVLRQE